MSAATRTVNVRPIPGEAMCYFVESWSSPNRPHRVELRAYGGMGECSCKDWQTRRGPLIKKMNAAHTTKPGALGTLCRHTSAARWHLINSILADLGEHNSHE